MLGRKILALNSIIPLILGGVIYYLVSPNVAFVKIIDGIVGWNCHLRLLYFNNVVLRFLRCYFLDAIWAYSLTFAIAFTVIGDDGINCLRVLTLGIIFSSLIEGLQWLEFYPGTFDFVDILFQSVAVGIACLIMRIKIWRGKDEK